MSFLFDKQTQNDLNLFGSRGKQTVYTLFNRTRTKGGANQLEEIFRYPLNDANAIRRRLEKIRFFKDLNISFPFSPDLIDAIEQYLSNCDTRSQLANDPNTIGNTIRNLVGADTEKQLLIKGINAVLKIQVEVGDFVENAGGTSKSSPLFDILKEMTSLVNTLPFKGNLTHDDYVALDKHFRFVDREKVVKLLYHIYTIDVFVSAAKVAIENNYVLPVLLDQEPPQILITGLFHPLVNNAVPNNLLVDVESNIIFLTGANMAGKSTFMKSFGIAVFLSHIGFPVPAVKMEFTVLDGLFTTINLPDNINSGYSHFYAEVMRVKRIAEQLKLGKKLLVIFDELFRGTNVKDAHDATVAITGSLAKKSNCIFLVSTHIIEAGEQLKNAFQNVNFVFLPTHLMDGKPVYTYKLERGISNDRHGMIIIQNEGILEILKSRTNLKNKA